MRLIHSFSCDAGHTTDKFVDSETYEIECPVCQATAKRIVTPVKIKRDINSAAGKERWAKQREKQIKYEKKHGVTL